MPVCRFHLAGNCRYGSTCRNSHQPPACSYFAAGNCRRGQQCDFRHENRKRVRADKVIFSKEQFPAPPNRDSESGFRFLRVPSTFDNLSNKFRFSVPSPSPSSDQIFYSSDSDWCESVEGEERLGSCTLALYTCDRCNEQVLAQEGEERITCPECVQKPIKLGGAEIKESVEEEQNVKRNVKKKKKRKKKAQVPLPPSVPSRMMGAKPEVEVYQTPEGVKIYRVKEEQIKADEVIDQLAEQNDNQSESENHFDTTPLLDSGSELDPEPFLNMNEKDDKSTCEQEISDCYHSDKEEVIETTEPKSSPKTSQQCNSETNQNTQNSTNFNEGVATSSSKSAPMPKKSRNKTQRRRTKRQYRKQESPEPHDSDSAVFNTPRPSLMMSLMPFLALMPVLSTFCISMVIWISEMLLHLFCLCLAITLFVLRLAIVLVVNIMYISYHLVMKLIHPFCFYLLHPIILSLPGKSWKLCQQVRQHFLIVMGKGDCYAVPLLQLDRCKGRGVREQFTSTGARLNFLAGVRCEVEEEAEKHFSLGLEVEPGNARLLSARARTRYNQHKLCLALEDLARLERSTMQDLLVGANCYLGLGMFDMAKEIVKVVKDREEVNPSEVTELNKQLVMEETLANLPDYTQVGVLSMLVKQQTASSLRYQVRLAELTGDISMMKAMVANLEGGKGEKAAYCMYMTGLVLYHTGNLAKAEQLLLSCGSPCRVARCKYLAQLARVARERLKLAQHCLNWGRVDQGEELFKQAVEVDLSNLGVCYLSKLGLAKCSLVRGDTTTCLAILQELLTCKLEREVMVKVIVVKAGAYFKLGRYQDVITLVLSVPCYMDNKELVSLMDKARQELKSVKEKPDGGSYYDLLGLESSAGEGEIKAAFKRLARENHPDKFVDVSAKAKQEEIMKEINQAYSTLSDDVSRAEYDSMMNREDTREQNMGEEEMMKVFQEFFDEVQKAANDWALNQAMKGRKVNKTILNLYISDYLINNKEYFTTKYKLQSEVFQAFSDNFKSSGSGTWGKRRNRRRK